MAISIPVSYQRSKWISVPREISIPRPMIEKRVVRKMVPKVIQVEEEYEIDCGMTELATVFVGADINNDGRLSMSEWQSKGYDSSMFVSCLPSPLPPVWLDAADVCKCLLPPTHIPRALFGGTTPPQSSRCL